MNQADIQHIFQQRYNRDTWINFLGQSFSNAQLFLSPELLPGINTDVATKVNKLGFITLNEDGIERQIEIYEVTLAKGIVLEKNRVGLRNLLRKYWKNIDGAFIAYQNAENINWRFTYVSELTGFDADGELVSIITEPKRYTYILGEGETCRTAAERFAILINKGKNVTLDDIKDAFSVEKLSKDFFDGYKLHYDIFCEFMVSRPNIRQAIFNGDEKKIRDFNKKLLGRIVFLYFIQKKGWLGVPKQSKWGDGRKDFISYVFETCRNKELFYSEILVKLFFDTLNTKRKDDIIELIKGDQCRIPYLNGGLFEEENSKFRSLIFPAQLFSNLFTFFNQYNFTIYEDDPNDHTIAVDPEMLGHIFENLLEDNKDKGAYYTPKEIVHYMCQESLIEYLTTWFEHRGYQITGYVGFNKPDQFQIFSVNEGRKGQMLLGYENKSQTKVISRTLIEKLLKKNLDESDKIEVEKHKDEFQQALDNVKICDPAIGSGAFPMGLLHEIFTVKQALHTSEFGNNTNFDASGIKRNIIQNSIYGVDIERGAVDIARLRFWLALIVDEHVPNPLPNLDYKIVVGDSLVSKLGESIIDIDWKINASAHGLFGADLVKEKGRILNKISNGQKDFFNPESDKKKLAADIRNFKIDLLINQLELMVKTQGIEVRPYGSGKTIVKQTELYLRTIDWKNQIERLKRLKRNPDLPLNFFDWKLDFPEVMNEKVTSNVGFDIVIGNPPYGNLFDDNFKIRLREKYPELQFKIDAYSVFLILGHRLQRINGYLMYIIPSTFMDNKFEENVREMLLVNGSIKLVHELDDSIFGSVCVHSMIIGASSKIIGKDYEIKVSTSLNFNGNKDLIPASFFLKQQFKSFAIRAYKNKDFINKINQNSLPLYKVLDVRQAIKSGNDKEYIAYEKINDDWKPILGGKHINKYFIRNPKLYLLYGSHLACPRDKNIFEQPKILIREAGNEIVATYDDSNFYIMSSLYNAILINDSFNLKYVLALLNSSVFLFLMKLMTFDKTKGAFTKAKIFHYYDLPIKIIGKAKQNKICDLVDQVISIKSKEKDATSLEQQIDNIVFKLYELSYDEVKVIKPDFSLSEREFEDIIF